MTAQTGTPRQYVLVNAARNDDRYWAELWRARDDPGVRTAFADTVLPQCPLLTAERADGIVLPGGLQAPEGSAWVSLHVDLARFLDTSGSLKNGMLRRALETCVEVGETIHDQYEWPTQEMRHDSWLNRRLSVLVSGFGDVLRTRELDPAEHGSLRFLNQALLFARQTLQRRSRQIAMRTGQLPAITLSDPSDRLPGGGVREDWRRRWREAVQATRVRHRNLLVLSPWSLFPTDEEADYRYSELLPLLRHADACAFDRHLSIAHWSLDEFKHFHQRARAVLQQRGANSQFAKGV